MYKRQILSLPVAGIGAYLGIWICGLENNIYFQIGLVMLVGLVAKLSLIHIWGVSNAPSIRTCSLPTSTACRRYLSTC